MARNRTAACMIGKLGEGAKDFSDDELDEIIERLEGRAKQRQANGFVGDDTRARFADAERAAYELRLAAAVTRRNAALNVAVGNAARRKIELFGGAKGSAGMAPAKPRVDGKKVVTPTRQPGGMNDVAGLRSIFYGSNKQVDEARTSLDARTRARYNEMVEAMFAELRKEGALEYLQGRKVLGVGLGPGFLDQHIMDELWELTSPNGKPGISESPEALKAARILHKYLDHARIKQNRNGAFIEELRGYIAYQMHDPEILKRAGYAKWRDDVLRHGLDVARTFGTDFDMAKLDEALQGIYDTLASGQLSKDMPIGPELDKSQGVNVAKQVSHRRVLHFNDAKGWGGYNAEYGHGSLLDAVLWTLDRGAKTTAMLETLGTNPRAMFTSLRDELMQLNRRDPEVVKALRSAEFDRLMDAADGAVDQVDSPMFATVGAVVRTIETQASLGGMVLSALTDMPTQAARLTYNGKNFFEALGETVSNFIGGNSAAADHLAFGVQGMISDIQSRWHGNDSLAGRLGKLNQIFFKANLAHWWDQRRYRAFIASISSELYAARNTHWEGLKDDVRGTLAAHGFDTDSWDVARQYGAVPSGENGVIHGEAMRHVPDAALKPLLGKRRATAGALDRERDRLEQLVRGYYADQLAWATLQPGIREKALTTMGQKRGTALGELARSFFLFKSYPLQMWSRVIGQFTQEDQHVMIARNLFAVPKSEGVKLAQTIAAMTALGYVAFTMKDIAKGRTPRDPRDAKTWGAAFMQGGGLGLYGDFLFGQSNRYGQSILGSLGGPVAGDFEAAFKIYNELIHAPGSDDPNKALKKAGDLGFKFAKENTPFANIFYARAALDYLIFYRIQEWMNPGSLRRMERRVKEENNQEFILPPSQVVN
jgi:hypothetical protein